MLDEEYENKMVGSKYKKKKLSTAKDCIALDPNGNQHVLSGQELNALLHAFGLEGVKKAEELGWRFL